jgi:Spy/CpxP family protein refolding chaperone
VSEPTNLSALIFGPLSILRPESGCYTIQTELRRNRDDFQELCVEVSASKPLEVSCSMKHFRSIALKKMEEPKMKTTVLIALAVAVVMCVAPAWSQGRPGPGGPPHGAMGAVPPPPPADAIANIAQLLGLTTDQATALKTILTANDTVIKPLMEAARTADKALHDAVVALDFTTAADLVTAASDAQLALTNANIDAWVKIQTSGILTTDQLTKLLAGPGPGGPPPPSASTSSTRRR